MHSSKPQRHSASILLRAVANRHAARVSAREAAMRRHPATASRTLLAAGRAVAS